MPARAQPIRRRRAVEIHPTREYDELGGFRPRTGETSGRRPNIDPERCARDAAREFSRLIRRHQESPRQHYGIDQLVDELSADHRHKGQPIWDPRRADEREIAFIHKTKVTDELQWDLVQRGLGLDSRDGNRNWVGVHPAVASVYMTALADSISSRQGLNPVSDSASHLVAVGGWSVDRLATALLRTGPREEQLDIGDDSPAATLAFSALRTVTPANLSEVSAATIIDLRERYGPELVRFQDAIRIATEAAGLADIKDADSYESRLKEAYEDYVAPRVAALEHDLKLFGIETIPTYLSLRTTLPPTCIG